LSLDIGPELGWSGKLSLSIVPPGEHTRATFSIPRDRDDVREVIAAVLTGTFNVTLRYTDINGTQDTITEMTLHRNPDRTPPVHVRQVYLRRPDETEPFAASGPADP